MSKKKKKSSNAAKKVGIKNPLYEKQQAFLKPLSERERNELFHPEIPADRRGQLWMDQADLGEELVNQYAWATPSPHALKILKEFSPIVEVGCGANAYWASCMAAEGIDVVAYDMQVDTGGKIKPKNGGEGKQKASASDSLVQQGGPSSLKKHKDRALFLCYPDEDGEGMGDQCLEHYTGTYVIHVGESILDSNLSMDQAPWGRSSSSEFQTRLAAEYHCILKVELPSWLHVRDSISVWKRSETSTIVFAADSEEEDEEDEEIEYRHIPCSERLPINVAAPCCAHLLPPLSTTAAPTAAAASAPAKSQPPSETKNRDRANSSDGTKKKQSADKPTKATEKASEERKSPARSLSESNDSSSSKKKKNKKRSRSDSTDSNQKRSRSDSVDSQKKRKRSSSTDSASSLKLHGRERSDSTDSAKKRRKLEKNHQRAIDTLFEGGYDIEGTPPRKRAKGGAHSSPW